MRKVAAPSTAEQRPSTRVGRLNFAGAAGGGKSKVYRRIRPFAQRFARYRNFGAVMCVWAPGARRRLESCAGGSLGGSRKQRSSRSKSLYELLHTWMATP